MRTWRWLAAVLLAMSVLLVGTPAHADDNETPSSWRITKYHVDATPATNGTTTVTVDLDFDFARDPGHGPFIVLVTRMRVPDNPDLWRNIDIRVQSVTSATGARTDTQITREGDAMLVRVGRQGTRFTGVQNYQITYTATGLIDPDNANSGLDEFNWTAIGPAWQVPINDIRVTVNGPVPIERTACWQGRSMTLSCDAPEPGQQSSTWTLDRLDRRQGMQVVAGFPPGTYAGVEPRFTKRYHLGNMFPVTPATVGGAGVLGGLGLLAVFSLFRRNGRDRAYLGLTPGLTPAAGSDERVGYAGKTPVTVQFHPPKGARPGEVGVLIDETSDNRDVTATIVDLAVRGHLTIEQPSESEFTLRRLRTNDPVAPYEAKLLRDLFLGQSVVTQSDMRHKSRADVLTKTKQRLYQRVTNDLGWFRGNPQNTRAAWAALAVAAMIGALVVSAVLGVIGWGVAGAGLVVSALALFAVARHMPARTADGSATLAQTKGFELYLRTAEADQIRFEEGIDVFSKYLPYAIVFGVADRWARIFQELAEQGRYQGDTSWYVGNQMMFMHYGFGGMVNSLTSSMSSAMSQAVTAANTSSAGSIGGSGFSGGGGGFGGGGGGGW